MASQNHTVWTVEVLPCVARTARIMVNAKKGVSSVGAHLFAVKDARTVAKPNPAAWTVEGQPCAARNARTMGSSRLIAWNVVVLPYASHPVHALANRKHSAKTAEFQPNVITNVLMVKRSLGALNVEDLSFVAKDARILVNIKPIAWTVEGQPCAARNARIMGSARVYA